MTNDNKKIGAGIVTYNPDINRLQENIEAIYKQIDKLVVVDNGSDNINEIESVIGTFANVSLIINGSNLGIAKALNQVMSWGVDCDYSWVLTLDQDTVCDNDLITIYTDYIMHSECGIITSLFSDRNAMGNESLAMMHQNEPYSYIDVCITSASLTNVHAWQVCGGFDEKLFIDMVDNDFCLSLKENGYKVLRINKVCFCHEIGNSKTLNILGLKFNVTNHSASRKYTITRNSIYLIKKHKLNVLKEYFIVYRRILTVLFFEKDKINKTNSILKGIRDGRKL